MSSQLFEEPENRAAGVLILLGVIIITLSVFWRMGVDGFVLLAIYAIVGAISIVSELAMCMLAAKLLNFSFGEARSAAVKLTAAVVFPAALNVLLPGWLGGSISTIAYYCVMVGLFDLEFYQVFILTVLTFMVGLFLAMVIAAISGDREVGAEMRGGIEFVAAKAAMVLRESCARSLG